MDLQDELIIHMNMITKNYAGIIMEKLNAKELRILVNYGNNQKVKHYHLHLLPNFGMQAEKNLKEIYEILNGQIKEKSKKKNILVLFLVILLFGAYYFKDYLIKEDNPIREKINALFKPKNRNQI